MRLARRSSFFDHSPPVPVPPPPSPNNLEYLLAVSKNLAHPLHPVYDDGKDGGWEVVGVTFCVVEFLYFGLCHVLGTEGLRSSAVYLNSLGGDKLGARDRILNTKVARQAYAGHAPGAHWANIPPGGLIWRQRHSKMHRGT